MHAESGEDNSGAETRIAWSDASRRETWPDRDELKLGSFRKLTPYALLSKAMRQPSNVFTNCISGAFTPYACGW
jgi:hypothetical protein